MKKKIGTLKREAISNKATRWILAAVLLRYCDPTWMPMTPSIEMPRMYSMAAKRGFFIIKEPPENYSLRMKSMCTEALSSRLPAAIGVDSAAAFDIMSILKLRGWMEFTFSETF